MFNNLFIHIDTKLHPHITALIRSVYVLPLLLFFLGSLGICENQAENTMRNSDIEINPKKPECNCPPELDRVKEFGGEVLVDGSLRVLEPIMGKVFDLVEVSTPVTPSTNHARLFLRADGTKQSLIVLFDDSTAVKIAGN